MYFQNIIHTIVVWQSFLLCLIFLTPKYRKRKGNLYLALLLFTLGVHFTYNFLWSQQILTQELSRFSCSYGFLYGPLIYFHIKSRLIRNHRFGRRDILHFLPFFAIVLAAIFNKMSCSQEFAFLLLLSMLLYCFFGYYEILNYKKTIKTVTTAISIPEIKWLKLLLLVMLAIIVCNILSTALPEVIIFGESLSTETIVQFEVLILVNLITFQGLKNPQYFRQIGRDDVRLVKEIYRIESTSRKQEHTLVPDKEEIARIEEYLEKNKPYLNSDLTLSMLSDKLGMHPKLLSQMINRHFKVNFSEYINTLRVKHAKYLLENTRDAKLTIMEVMYDSGFNSRSVFNTFFKKKLGVTPSEFVSGLKNN